MDKELQALLLRYLESAETMFPVAIQNFLECEYVLAIIGASISGVMFLVCVGVFLYGIHLIKSNDYFDDPLIFMISGSVGFISLTVVGVNVYNLIMIVNAPEYYLMRQLIGGS